MKADKKKVERDILPNVEHSCFEFDETAMYFVDGEGEKHKIVDGGIYANGIRDLCIYWRGPKAGDIAIGKTVDISKDRILWIPKGDILWLKFESLVYVDRHSVFVDIESDPRIKPMVSEMLRRFGTSRGADYEMFGGGQYF
jgi:hypothetical protein